MKFGPVILCNIITNKMVAKKKKNQDGSYTYTYNSNCEIVFFN